MRILLTVLVMMGLSAMAHAQTFTISPASGPGGRTVSWDVPGAISCQAAGDWSGNKAANGSESLMLSVGVHTVKMTCTFADVITKGSAKLSWQLVTQNIDNSPYTNAKGYLIYGEKRTPPSALITTVTPASLTSYTVPNLDGGLWYFAVKSLNSADVASDLSNITSKIIPNPVTTTPPPFIGSDSTTVTLAPPKAPILSVE